MWSNSIETIRKIEIEELLRREMLHFQAMQANSYLRGKIFFAELNPVITTGLRGARVSSLKSTRARVVPVRRGGFETYHGPGQWVVFWTERLERVLNSGNLKSKDSLSIELYTERLLGALKAGLTQALGRADIECGRNQRLGLWMGVQKLASMGFSLKQGILNHGFSLNVYPTHESFKGINPCGFQEASPGFLYASQDVGEAHMDSIRRIIIKILQAEFDILFVDPT